MTILFFINFTYFTYWINLEKKKNIEDEFIDDENEDVSDNKKTKSKSKCKVSCFFYTRSRFLFIIVIQLDYDFTFLKSFCKFKIGYAIDLKYSLILCGICILTVYNSKFEDSKHCDITDPFIFFPAD